MQAFLLLLSALSVWSQCTTPPLSETDRTTLHVTLGTCVPNTIGAAYSIADGTTCNLACTTGYQLTSGDPSTAVTCTGASWSTSTIVCDAVPQASPIPTDVVVPQASPIPTLVKAALGQSCTGDNVAVGTTPVICDTNLHCDSVSLKCVQNVVVTDPVVPQASPIPTIVKSPIGGQCTGDVSAGVLFIGCVEGAHCDALKCVANVVATTTPKVETGSLGMACGGAITRPCYNTLVCTANICSVPTTVATTPMSTVIGVPGGVCGGKTYTKCPDGYICTLSPTATAGATLDTVGGFCAQKTSPTVAPCLPGFQPVLNASGLIVCVPCLYGTHSENGGTCSLCPFGRYTPLPATVPNALTVGPIQCTTCPATGSNWNCVTNPICENCADASKQCIWAPSPYPAISIVKVPQCVARVCTQACIQGSTCVNGECKPLPTLDTVSTTVLTDNCATLATAGVDCTKATAVATTLNGDGTVPAGTTTVLNGDNIAIGSTTVNAPIVIKDGSLIADTAVINQDGATIASGNTQVQVGDLNVVGGTTPATVTLSAQVTDNGTPTISVGTANLGPNSLNLNGDGQFHIDGTVSSPGSTITVSGGATVGGTVSTPIVVAGTNPTLVVGGDLKVNADTISGTVGAATAAENSVVRVDAKGTLTLNAPGTTVNTNVQVDGTAVIADATLKGTLDVTGVIQITTTHDSPPHFEIFKSCAAGGVIKYTLADYVCGSKVNTKLTGTLFTSAAINSNFACTIDIIGKDGCVQELTVKWAGPTRRLLGQSTTDCNTATLTNTDAQYTVCSTQPSSGAHISLSYITLFATLFVALFLRV